MAIAKITPHDPAQQPDTAASDMIKALRLSFDVMSLAGAVLDAASKQPRDIDAPVIDAFDRAQDEHRLMIGAVRSLPPLTIAQALAKLQALNHATEALEYPNELAANHAAFVADVARIAEAGQ